MKQKLTEQLQLIPADVVVAPMGSLPKTSSASCSAPRRACSTSTAPSARKATARSAATARSWCWPATSRCPCSAVRSTARRSVVEHTLEIRSMGDALEKLKLAGTYTQKRVSRLLG